VLLDNFFLLIGIAAIYSIPSTVVPVATAWRGHLALNAIQLVLVLIVYPLSQAALIAVVAAAYVGQPVSMTESLQAVRAVLLRFLGLNFLSALLFYLILATGLAAVSFLVISPPDMLPAIFIAVVLTVVLAVELYVFINWALVKSVIVVERMGFSAFRRSRQLVTGSWWQTCALTLVTILTAELPYRTLKFVSGYVPGIGTILTHAALAVFGTYGTVAFVIYYFDRRCRLEDFDLRLLAEQVRAEILTPTASVPNSSAPA
jgi:hypothetical protein